MPGTRIARLEGAQLTPTVAYYPVEASQTIYAGDWVVLIQEASNYNTPRIRKVKAADITGTGNVAFADATALRGILGIALVDVVTDSSGNVSQLVPSTIDAAARVQYSPPSQVFGYNIATLTEGSEAEDKGKFRCPVAIANDRTVFAMKLAGASDAAVTANSSYVGQHFGIQIANTTDFKISTGEVSSGGSNDAIFTIVGVNYADPNFNTSSNAVEYYVKVKSAFQQYALGIPSALD